MFRAIPTNSKLCLNHELKRNWKIHDDKVKAMKSKVSKDRPQHFNFLEQRAKKAAIEDTRNMEIDKQNKCLLRKIQQLQKKGHSVELSRTSGEKLQKKSLNEPYRKRVLVQIVEENQDMLKRIMQKKSVYNVKKWQKQRQKVQKNISLLSEFPYKRYPKTQTRVNLWMTEEDFTKKSRVLYSSHERIGTDQIQRKDSLVYSGTQRIGQSYYLVQTYASKNVFNVQLQNLQNEAERYRLQMNEQEAQKLLNQHYEGKMRKLLEQITINQKLGLCELNCLMHK